MGETSFPVDLWNPGQVLACLGFLEAAETLLGDAAGGFLGHDSSNPRFHLKAAGQENPVVTVLNFLADASLTRLAPEGYSDGGGEDRESSDQEPLEMVKSFPAGEGDRMALPIRLTAMGRSVSLNHWADKSSRESFKLYAGNRSAYKIAGAMIRGVRKNPKKNQREGDLKTRGVLQMWTEHREKMLESPLEVVTPMGGSFNFDPRGAWTAIDAGYSPNDQGDAVAGSPLVEILAAWGLENSRPVEYDTRKVRYFIWGAMLPLILARIALTQRLPDVPARAFRFGLALAGKNKVVNYAEEEPL